MEPMLLQRALVVKWSNICLKKNRGQTTFLFGANRRLVNKKVV